MSWQTIVKENNLDISELKLSHLLEGVRFDAEVYSRDYLLIDNLLSKKSTVPLIELSSSFSKGIFDIKADCYLEEGGVPFVRISNLKNALIDSNNLVYIPEDENTKNKKTALKRGDIVLSKTATASASYVDIQRCNVSQDTIAFRYEKTDLISSEALVVFLNSKYGLKQMQRWFTGNIQMHLNLPDAKKIKVPVLPKNLNDKITDSFLSYIELKRQSALKYIEAEQILLKEINLDEYKGTDEVISIRNFSEALTDNRFDAEYWQPDFDVILETVSKYKKGVSTIGDEFQQSKGNFKAEEDKEYNYVEIGDVNVSTGEVDSNVIIGAELPANAKIKFGKRQLITSKVRPNRGATAILDNREGYIGSGAFTVLTEQDNINLETLMVYLKAKPIRELLLRYNTGTSYPVITDADVLRLPIPLIDKTLQKKISELVSVSAKEQQEATVRLEKAKRAVEIFIEKDEKTAFEYLGRKIQS
jgi:type I restriction enzyme, S subunit